MVKELLRILLALALLFFVGAAKAISIGTGFFIASNGLIATNYHVIQGGDEIAVRDSVGKTYKATVVATDKANDLAILKVDGLDFTYLPIRQSSQVRKGESVYTLGFPNIAMQGLEAKVTDGIVSSLSGLQGEPNAFQISVPIQPGNSGGPLFDKRGAVVGVVVAKLSMIASLNAGAGLPENVNFAVKSNYLNELIGTIRSPLAHKEVTKKGAVDFPDVVERVERAAVLVAVAPSNDKNPSTEQNGARSVGPGPTSSSQMKTKRPNNSECSVSSECESSYCNSGRCMARGWYSQGLGETCQWATDCVGSLFCIDGRCGIRASSSTSSNYSPCSSSSQCGGGGICANGRCYMPRSKSVGERCWASPECRGQGSLCRNGYCAD